ncbi:aminotransferase class V-fold PLP-dependent enzyme [Methanobrevibacter arboriphilus]|uniref:aminotransferase class V-fold PLP-dependent enzyme n=1 Tax=Methanobrevibacter arboriphilus TaxID=39441 RepID=UPI0029813399|nr:aminotransferase class V-fold PLP-dependent enzyme [Methanobrevibacter arboriphilus]
MLLNQLGMEKLILKKVNADFIAAPGHKGLLGPSGTGFLYGKKRIIRKVIPNKSWWRDNHKS